MDAQPWAEVSSTVTPNFYRMKTSGDAVLNAVKSQKGKGFKAFKRWEKYWDQRVFSDGTFPPANLVQKNWELYQFEKSLSALIPGSSWTSLGPNSSSGGYAGIGRINRLTFHPTNTSIIFACTAGGGLWKTTNGGTSWVPLTDNLASIGTSGLVINPTDPNIMYLATGDGDGADTYSYGVLKSTDGGVTWNTTGLTFTTGTVIYKLQQHATDPNILLAGTNGGLYRTANGGTSWTKVVASGQFYDIEALSASNMVAVTKGGFYRSTDSGATWVLVTTIASTGRIALAVSASNPDFVGALVSNTSNGFKGFYASVDGGLTYTLRSSTPNLMGWETNGSDSGGQAWYDLCIAVSPTDVNQIIVGGVNTWKSNNGGVSWSIMTNWYQTSTVPAMHADQHDLIFLNSTTIYAANDGGIYRSTNNGVSWTDLTNGMSISQLYRAGAAQTDTRIIAGLQDNGTKLRSTTGTWSDEIGGDGMDCAIDPTNASFMYGTLYYGDIQRSTNGGSSWTSITPSTGTDGAWVSPVLLDPVNPSTIYLGYRDLMKSTDRGTTWSAISTGQTGGNFISNIAVAPSDPLVIYISWGTAMAKTVNGGTSWTTITMPISSQISSLLVDPTNPNNLYATYSNFTAGSKVYFSNNGGTSWTNISGTLPNIPANKIIYQTGSNGALYLGMDVGIYYRDNTQTDWSLYNSGLPNVEIFDLEIRYSDKKLIAATYGRGLWESPLYVGTPLSVPAVSSFSPTSATKGNTVTITGSNFNGVSSVSFGGTAATSFAVVSPTSITAIVGNGNSGNVSVTNSAGTGSLSGFTYINTSPTISSFTPTSGKTGQVVNIIGTNFTGATAVSFGGTAATTFTVVSATSINATIGAGASGTVSVTTASGTGTLAGFTYLPPPTIASFSPTSAGTGQTVTITGTNFTGATAVSFGGIAATSFTVVSATSITAVVGAGATGSVSVTTANGIANRAGFTFITATPAPAITSFTPTSGKTGQAVNIIGTNFTGATAVSFGGTAATTFTVVSTTTINATVGGGASGVVSVTTAFGTGTLAGFTYLPPPTITSFSPTSAGTGQTVTITGTNFTGATAVSFGGTAATSFTVVSATSITAIIGAGATGSVSVTTSNGIASRAGFTFISATPAPTITSFTPTLGKTGQVVTITGTNFTGASAVSFGGTAATTFTVVSATSINATVGAGASGAVSVTTASGTGTLAGFTYLPPPTITSFSPTSAGTGQTVTITGTNFTGATAVSFGGTAATSFTVVSATSITAVVGTGATGSVSVTTSNGIASRVGFTFITTTPAPAITSFSPTSAGTGQTVTITGTNFTGATAVSFGGTAATTFTVVSATSINATLGAGTSGTVSVTTLSGSGTLAGFTYLPPPTITSFSPTSGKTGQAVTITGTNFTGATAVSFGGTAATSFTVVSPTTITAVVGTGKTGNVRVVTANGAITKSGFTYLAPPTISSFSPTSAGTGQTVTITGTDFTGATAVSFGGTAATSFTVVSATSITAVVGTGATGSLSVTTSNGIGSKAGFTFISATTAPAISSFTPTSGKTGQVVNLTGTNFTGATAVSFGGTAATTFTVVSATSINATVGAGASGTVSVTTASGTGTLAGFTYLPPPTIASFSPTSAGTGQTVTITGTNFTGATSVIFGGTAATSFTVVSATSIIAVVGAGATGNVRVTTANGNVNRGGFTYILLTNAPTLTSFSPTKAVPGSNITLTGTGFNPTLSQNTVWIGASRATISAATTTSITARVPVGATTDYIRILNSGTQQGVQSNEFFVSSYSPSKDSIQSAEISPKVDLTTLGGPEDIRVSDLDGDGKPDIVVANYTAGSISVFRNTSVTGNINVANFVRNDFTAGTGATFISVADMDNDGKQDVIVANQGENTISIFKNISTSGNISFSSQIKIATPSTPIGIGIGDFDRNGWLDIATANHGNGTVSIFTNKGIFNAISTNNFNPRFGLITGLNPITIDVADIDGDSKSDIVVGNYGSNSISIFKNNYISGTLATSSFSTKLDFNAGNKPGYVKLGDMDGDAKLDVVVLAEGTNSVGILRNISTAGVLSSTSFASRVNFNTGITPYYISVGDLTGNGKLDILITNFGDGTATVWQNKATPGSITSASFFKRLNFTVGTKPYAGLLADIDGDAKTDILVSNTGSNTLSILRNTVGAQMIVSPTSSNLPATGGSLTASVSSNLVWKVSSNANWLIPIGVSGKNSGSIRVTFLANNGISRKGTITFTADGITRTMEIIQAAKPGIMNPANELSGEFSEKMEVNAKEITHIDWELFPNPSDGIVNLSVKFSNLLETGILNISDIHGRVVRSVTNVRTGNYQFDLSSEPKGTYLFSLQDENGKGLIIKQIILN